MNSLPHVSGVPYPGRYDARCNHLEVPPCLEHHAVCGSDERKDTQRSCFHNAVQRYVLWGRVLICVYAKALSLLTGLLYFM